MEFRSIRAEKKKEKRKKLDGNKADGWDTNRGMDDNPLKLIPRGGLDGFALCYSWPTSTRERGPTRIYDWTEGGRSSLDNNAALIFAVK